jgi:hypothetical protein
MQNLPPRPADGPNRRPNTAADATNLSAEELSKLIDTWMENIRESELRPGRLASIPGAVIELSPAPAGGDVDVVTWADALQLPAGPSSTSTGPSMLNHWSPSRIRRS